MSESQNQYAERDIMEQKYYALHIDRMTAEGLHDKSSIAAELAHRDEEIDRLRAELEARDKAVPVMYVLEENGTIYPAESGETVEQVEDLAKARHCKGDRHRIVPLYTHPPRQAVPDGWMLFPVKAWRFLCGETAIFPPAGEGVWFGDEVVDPKTGRPQPFWWRSHIRAMLTAAPEAQEQGEVVVTWTPDRQRIAAVTRQDSEGRILSVIAEAPEARSDAETCPNCNGSGMALNDGGDPDTCGWCRGDTVLPSKRTEAEIQADERGGDAYCEVCDSVSDLRTCPLMTGSRDTVVCGECMTAWYDQAITDPQELRDYVLRQRDEAARLREGEK